MDGASMHVGVWLENNRMVALLGFGAGLLALYLYARHTRTGNGMHHVHFGDDEPCCGACADAAAAGEETPCEARARLAAAAPPPGGAVELLEAPP